MEGPTTASLLRRINRAAVLEVLRRESPIARTQIARRVHLSLPTVMRIIDELKEEGLVREEGKSEPTRGRRRSLLAFNGEGYAVIGVDMGGTKMFGGVANLNGDVLYEKYTHPGTSSPEESVERLCDLLAELIDAAEETGLPIRGIGIGAPGVTLHEEGIVVWAPSLGWRDLPLQQILADRFPFPIFVENDVNLAALGEMGFGAGQGARDLVCIAVGTGIGAGIIVGGALYRGHHEAAGEVGYLLPGTQFLGRRYNGFGALESLASGTGVAERARKVLAERGMLPSNGKITAQEVFAAARRGEDWAQQVVDETVDYLALAIASVSAVLDPEVVVLGGGVARSADLLIEPIRRRLEGVVPYVPRLAASPLGRRAALMGAVMLVLNVTMESFVVRRLP